jgi:hypothetical protein
MDTTMQLTFIVTGLALLLAESRRESGKVTALNAGALLNGIYLFPWKAAEMAPVPPSSDDVPPYLRGSIRQGLCEGSEISEDIVDDVMREAVAAAHHVYRLITLIESRG